MFLLFVASLYCRSAQHRFFECCQTNIVFALFSLLDLPRENQYRYSGVVMCVFLSIIDCEQKYNERGQQGQSNRFHRVEVTGKNYGDQY